MKTLNKKFTFKQAKIFPEANSIKYRGEEKIIEPRLMKLFLMLYQKKGHLVSKKEIMNHIWSNRVVTDNSLANAISLLRNLFEKNWIQIKTVSGKGYILVNERTILNNYFDKRSIISLIIITLLLYILLVSGLVTWAMNLPAFEK